MIPIDYGHDATMTIGHMVERDGKHILEFMSAANITVDDINNINGFIYPNYIVTAEKDGIVLEAELVGFSVVEKQKDVYEH